MTNLFIRYRPFYDAMLARLARQEFTAAHKGEGEKFQKISQDFWNGFNDRLFAFYRESGFVLPEYWFAYPVHKWKNLIPFDEPMTFFIQDDLGLVCAELVHEICHTFFSYFENKETVGRLWHETLSKFSREDESTQKHLLVLPMTEAGLIYLFGERKASTLLKGEKKYEGLERAWKILEACPAQDKLDFQKRIAELHN